MIEELDTEYTDEITCPYCGWVNNDSWEADENGITFCGKCEKDFEFTRNVEVTYSTYRLEENK